ncbi:hypothetical protein V6N11_020923 [Hibiscus sabdariffa]|uniref:RNase H type-1 domain-containing protein n=1 Tax=Hibiscus sabdariffa TaxID=183260 RepID=A0ABR2Q9V6_9ROSI
MPPSGTWDFSLLSSIFPAAVAHRIVSIHCPNPNAKSDFCRWRWDESFSINSAYAKFLHVLCDCPYVHTVWSASLGSLLPATFFANNLDVWLLSSLRSSSPTPYPDVPWSILFASTCWHIWKTRNDLIFTGFVAPTDSTAARSINWSRHYSMVSSKITSRPIVRVDTPCRWLPPPSPWVCLNTDGSVCPRSKYGRARGIIRDSSGAWIIGYGHGIGIADVFTSELWAIYDGLLLTWQLGFKYIQVQSDCSKAISKLSDAKSLNGYSVLLRNILSLCQRNWAIKFLWIPRATNQVADKLLKQIPLRHFDMIRLDAPPDYLQSQLEQDNGSFYGLSAA